MRYLLIFMLLVAIFVVGKRSCFHMNFGSGVEGEGPVLTETRDVDGFDAIDLSIAGDVEVSIGDYRVEVRAQENLLPLLQTEVKEGTLRIDFEESVSYREQIKLYITVPSLEALELSGSGSIKLVTPIESDKMDIHIGGSGEVDIPNATFTSLECSVSGSGDINLGGSVGDAEINVSGSGEVNAKNMVFNRLEASISGSGSVYAHVNETLDVSVSGSGDMYYSGDPVVEKHVSGSGSVSKR
ncbi:MAG: head GIN domain-containing protein [Saprospiraceae bacterium]|nr:DUF2807 domain-containing protein [Saprospiraceae bacterium]MCB9342197.1 DUF2807 domain-containing protein [Lewinellaceae bacterium]